MKSLGRDFDIRAILTLTGRHRGKSGQSTAIPAPSMTRDKAFEVGSSPLNPLHEATRTSRCERVAECGGLVPGQWRSVDGCPCFVRLWNSNTFHEMRTPVRLFSLFLIQGGWKSIRASWLQSEMLSWAAGALLQRRRTRRGVVHDSNKAAVNEGRPAARINPTASKAASIVGRCNSR